jgi:CheY-like chemotaxis protein
MNLSTELCQNILEDKSDSTFTVPIPRVLIVDDESSIRDFIGEVLNESDYIADRASGAEEALRMLHDRHYDVLLTDYHMPRITGSQLIAKMRSEGIDIPVVLMTGQRDELLVRYPNLQVNAILAKPFMIEEMMETLSKALNPIYAGMVSKLVDLADETHELRRTDFL